VKLLHVRGENGSGKTTLLRALCGLSQPAAGDVRWDGRSIREQPETSANSSAYRHGNAIHGDLTPVENWQFEACLGAETVSKRNQRWKLKASVAWPAAGQTPLAGQKRRVALARLAVLKRTLWVLDEPFTALDIRAVDRLLATLARHSIEAVCASSPHTRKWPWRTGRYGH